MLRKMDLKQARFLMGNLVAPIWEMSKASIVPSFS
jgi:hypothetical protein